MSQLVPAVSRTRTAPTAATFPRISPAPVRVAVPFAATCPPYTVKTAFTASRNPPSPVACPGGSTSRTPRIGPPKNRMVSSRGADDAVGHVPLRVGHLLPGSARQLEPGVVEEEQRRQRDEHRVTGQEGVTAEAMHAVLDRVDDDRDHEEARDDHPQEAADIRDPLADPERQHGSDDRHPDERQPE